METSPSQNVLSHFAHSPHMGKPVLVTAGMFLPLVLIFGAFRIYANRLISRKSKLDEYGYFITCCLGIAMISFEVSIVVNEADIHHASSNMTPSIIRILIFLIALGPVLWLVKLTLFRLIIQALDPARWLRNCAYIGIITTGLFYAAHTIVFTVSCGPNFGAYAITSIVTGAVNFATNVYILVLPLPVLRALPLPRAQKMGVALTLFGLFCMCICSVITLVYRIQCWKSTNMSDRPIRLYVSLIVELALGLMIPCIPSVAAVYHHWTTPNIIDTATLLTSDMKGISTPLRKSEMTWEKPVIRVEEMNDSRPSSAAKRLYPHEHYMKALPATPFPGHTRGSFPVNPMGVYPMMQQKPDQKSDPYSQTSPTSVRSMSLPIMFRR